MKKDLSLFGFLKSYIPSPGRDPKEDYLTQLFAWCLMKLPALRREYCQYLFSRLSGPEIPAPDWDDVSVETQRVLKIGDTCGRIDLLISFPLGGGFLCEHKLWSGLGENQIAKYAENSGQLGPGKYYTVLLTASKAQHTQDADIQILWREVQRIMKALQADDLSQAGSFVIPEFISYLEEEGVGELRPIETEGVRGYWKAAALLDSVRGMFQNLARYDWKAICPKLYEMNPAQYQENPVVYEKWGRIGFELTRNWEPGVFAGVLKDWRDHKLPPLDPAKGPELVLFVDTEWKQGQRGFREKLLDSPQYEALCQRLSSQAAKLGYHFMPGIPESPWRVLVLRKPFLDFLGEKIDAGKQEEHFVAEIRTMLNLLTHGREIEQFLEQNR